MQNPNVIFNEILKLVATAQRHAGYALKNRQKVRRTMYRAAVGYQRLANSHYQWFYDQAMSVGGIDAMLAQWFAPLSLVGEDWNGLLRDVTAGVTEKEYLASTAGSFTRRKEIARLVDDSGDSPEPSEEAASPMSDTEALAFWKSKASALLAQLRAVKRDRDELRKIAARQEDRIRELEKTMNKIVSSATKVKVAAG